LRRLVAVAVALVVGSVVLGAAPALAAPKPVSPLFFGMHDPLLSTTTAAVPYGALRVWDVKTTWADIESTPGVFDFHHLDSVVAKARLRGAKVMVVLGATPGWAATDPLAVSASWLPPGSSSPPLDDAHWIRFVQRVAQRYRGAVESYQIWNEASLPVFWRGTPRRLALMTQEARRAIRRFDRRALVVSTPMLPRQPTWSTWSRAYLAALGKRHWPVDVFAIHSYTRDKHSNPRGRVAAIRKMKGVLSSAKVPARPVWDTEANYANNDFQYQKLDGQQAADWVARVYLDSLRLGITRTYWYALDAPVGHLGVTLAPGTAALRGYTSVRHWLLGRTFEGCRVTRAKHPKARVTTCRLAHRARSTYVVWSSRRPARLPAATRASHRVCGLLTGCARVTKRTRVTTSPVLLRP
jgi:polysaccharide biosynthesis protein PslG